MLAKAFTVFYFSISSMSFAGQSSCTSLFTTPSGDKYENFLELKKAEIEGVDFQIVKEYVGSSVTIVAPHAGRIEFGTSEITRAVARNSLNLYLFEGTKKAGNFELHITSDHFDEPQALDLMRVSTLGISIHGFKDDNASSVAIGGANKIVAARLTVVLQKLGFGVEFPSSRFKGESLDNIVNRAITTGVQLEISSKLRAELLNDPAKMNAFAKGIRSAIGEI